MIDWDKPIMFEDGAKATLAGTLSASGSFLTPLRKQEFAEHYAELYEMGVRRLVYRDGEVNFRAFNDTGSPIDITLEELFGRPKQSMIRVVQMELDTGAMPDNTLWGMF